MCGLMSLLNVDFFFHVIKRNIQENELEMLSGLSQLGAWSQLMHSMFHNCMYFLTFLNTFVPLGLCSCF